MFGIEANSQNASAKRPSNRMIKAMKVSNQDWRLDKDDKPFDPTPFLGFGKIILWGGNAFASRLPDHPKWFVWNKRPGVRSDDNSDCELAWTNLPGKAVRKYDQLWKGVCRAGRENLSRGGPKLHTFQKPVGLGRFCIAQAKLKPTDKVIDFFGGSGSFAVAALELGHPVLIAEKERELFEMICDRVTLAQLPLRLPYA